MADSFLQEVQKLRAQFESQLAKGSEESLDDLQSRFLGRKGLVTQLSRQLTQVDGDMRPVCGKAVNQFKQFVQAALEKARVQDLPAHATVPSVDITLPGRHRNQGSAHPLSLVLEAMVMIFKQLGFQVVEGPEIETDFYNFSALNIAEDHPARDMHDTFYFDALRLLRTHTSPVQIRVMEQGTPPFRIIAPGKVYRCDSDNTHSPMFHQIEGLCVGRNINFGNLKSILSESLKKIFDPGTELRFRPSFFPFTEPSAEVDISCTACSGKGCRVCSGTGWLEILGAGMVDPEVLSQVNLDPEEYTGYAFGMGLERIAMLKYGIRDIRLFYENHLEFLRQFQRVQGGLHL